jgi:hypothetical protein
MAIIFGVGSLQISSPAGIVSVGRLQNVSLNISYETAQNRGSLDVFPTDTQFFDGKIEGSFEHGSIELSQVAFLLASAGAYAGAAGSGTFTLTATDKPQAFQMVWSGVSNGITGTWKLQRVYVPTLSLDFSRTDYLLPSMSFICQDTAGTLLTFQQ